MRYENGILHADTHDLLGLIRTAQEIIPELDGLDLPENVELVLDQSPRSPVRVAAFRLTNCTGAYNSGRTLDGLEPRWAWKDANGVWHCESPPPVVHWTTRSELEARRWIANAGPIPVRPAPTPPPVTVPPGTYTIEFVDVDVVRVTPSNGRFVGPIRSPRAYTNVPEGVQGTVTRIVEEWFAAATIEARSTLVNELGLALPARAEGGYYRLALRRGRRWHWCHLRGGTNPNITSHSFTARLAAIRWVDRG